MDGQEFVDVIRLVVRDSVVSGELSVLQTPPGRRPSAEVLERSRWFNSLQENDRTFVEAVVAEVAHRAVFQFLCVLDGVVAIENGPEKGRIELWHVKEQSTLLNPPGGADLHDLL